MARVRITKIERITQSDDIYKDQYKFTCVIQNIGHMSYALDRFPAADRGDFVTRLTPALFIDFCKRCDFSVDYTVYATFVAEFMSMYYDQAKLGCDIFSEGGIRTLADAPSDCVDNFPDPNDFPTLDLLREVIYDNISS